MSSPTSRQTVAQCACTMNKGKGRRNVTKYVIREFISRVSRHAARYSTALVTWRGGYTNKDLEYAKNKADLLKMMDCKRDPGESTKNYGMSLTRLMNDPILHPILNAVMRERLDDFERGNYGRISHGQPIKKGGLECKLSDNRLIYKETLEELYKYSCDLLKNQRPPLAEQNTEAQASVNTLA